MPAALSDSVRAGWRSAGIGVAAPGRAPSRAVATTSPSAAVSSTASHGYGVWTRATACHSTSALIRSLHHSQFPLELLLERKREPVTVVLPTRTVADTIGPIVERLWSLEGLVDQVLVVDAASADGTSDIARS